MHAVDRADGKPAWTFRTRGRVDSSPVLAGDRLVFGSEDGRLYVLDAGTGQETWSYEIVWENMQVTTSKSVFYQAKFK